MSVIHQIQKQQKRYKSATDCCIAALTSNSVRISFVDNALRVDVSKSPCHPHTRNRNMTIAGNTKI